MSRERGTSLTQKAKFQGSTGYPGNLVASFQAIGEAIVQVGNGPDLVLYGFNFVADPMELHLLPVEDHVAGLGVEISGLSHSPDVDNR